MRIEKLPLTFGKLSQISKIFRPRRLSAPQALSIFKYTIKFTIIFARAFGAFFRTHNWCYAGFLSKIYLMKKQLKIWYMPEKIDEKTQVGKGKILTLKSGDMSQKFHFDPLLVVMRQ